MFDQFRFATMNDYNEYLDRKLKHYNQWLMDPKRDLKIPKPYPGFPEDLEHQRGIESLRNDFSKRQEVKEKQQNEISVDKPKKVRVKKVEGPSRQVQAQEIYKRLNGDRTTVVQAIQDELGMPPGSAMTYFYNAKKAVGSVV